MSLLSILGFGFLLGVRHASDADHVVAVSSIVAGKPRKGAWLLGAVWGLGHSLTVLVFGGLLIWLRLEVSPRVGLGLEFTVGIVLIVLGTLSVMGLWNSGVVAHTHEHGHGHGEHSHRDPTKKERSHEHEHLHLPEHVRAMPTSSLIRSALVGVAHGLAGSAAVALLVASTISDTHLALLYLAVFGLGTMAGMALLTALMQWSMSKLASWWAPGERALGIATGVLSLGFGAWIAYESAFSGGGFLSAAPSWTPH